MTKLASIWTRNVHFESFLKKLSSAMNHHPKDPLDVADPPSFTDSEQLSKFNWTRAKKTKKFIFTFVSPLHDIRQSSGWKWMNIHFKSKQEERPLPKCRSNQCRPMQSPFSSLEKRKFSLETTFKCCSSQKFNRFIDFLCSFINSIQKLNQIYTFNMCQTNEYMCEVIWFITDISSDKSSFILYLSIFIGTSKITGINCVCSSDSKCFLMFAHSDFWWNLSFVPLKMRLFYLRPDKFCAFSRYLRQLLPVTGFWIWRRSW